MNKQVDKYIKNIVNNSNLSKDERNDLKEYLYSSFYESYNNYITAGIDETVAIKDALDELGSKKEFEEELNTGRVSKLTQNISIIILTVWLLFIMLKYLKDFSYDRGFFRYPLQLKYFIPFSRLIEVISNYHQGDFLSIFDEYIVLTFFIPVGVLVPLATNKINNIKYNLKVFLVITFIIELIKYAFLIKLPHIDYIIFSVIFCCIGYVILIAILNIRKNIKKK